MNLIRVGRRTLNMDLVAVIDDRGPDDEHGGGGITVMFAIGGSIELKGEEAESLRRFLREYSRAPESAIIDYAQDRGPLLPAVHPGQREQGS